MNIKYFSWVRDRIGIEQEQIEIDKESISVKDLVAKLKKISTKHSEAFSDFSLIRCAVNMEVVDFDHNVKNDDEIAFFPPMTGG